MKLPKNILLLSLIAVISLSFIAPKAQAFDVMSSITDLTDSIASFFGADEEQAQPYGSVGTNEEGMKFHPRDLEVNIINQKGEKFRFDVELALSPKQHAKGLMNREFMEETTGMLFVFNHNEKRNFWMKDTLIPLDIIFIREDGTIDHIHSMAKPLDKSMVTSGRESYAVLEINGGLSDKLGIDKGDVVYHPIFRNLNRLEN